LVSRIGAQGDGDNADRERIQRVYRTLYQREATPAEIERGLAFLTKARTEFPKAQAAAQTEAPVAPKPRRPAASDEDEEPEPQQAAATNPMSPWEAYAQALLSSGEFVYLN
jgi:hypothetical protein